MKLEGNMRLNLTPKEALLIQDILEKREPMAIVKREGEIRDWYVCPRCHVYIAEDSEYCRKCGQRIDNKNIAF